MLVKPLEMEVESVNAITVRDAAGDVIFEMVAKADEVDEEMMEDAKLIIDAVNATAHAPLECPECEKVCKPTHEHKDGSVTYVCRQSSRHPDNRFLKFVIDANGDLSY